MKKWKMLNSKMAFDHKWFKVRQDTIELPNGKIIDDYFVWPAPNVTQVVPVTKDNEFVLVKQYKHGAGEILLEFPAGVLNDNEDPKDAALRELEEETGFTTTDIQLLSTMTSEPTKKTQKIYVYLAKNVRLDGSQHFDETEEIEVVVLPYQKVIEMIESGEFKVSGSVAAAYLACRKLEFPL